MSSRFHQQQLTAGRFGHIGLCQLRTQLCLLVQCSARHDFSPVCTIACCYHLRIKWLQHWNNRVLCAVRHGISREIQSFQCCSHVSDCSVQGVTGNRNCEKQLYVYTTICVVLYEFVCGVCGVCVYVCLCVCVSVCVVPLYSTGTLVR